MKNEGATGQESDPWSVDHFIVVRWETLTGKRKVEVRPTRFPWVNRGTRKFVMNRIQYSGSVVADHADRRTAKKLAAAYRVLVEE